MQIYVNDHLTPVCQCKHRINLYAPKMKFLSVKSVTSYTGTFSFTNKKFGYPDLSPDLQTSGYQIKHTL